MQPLLNLLLWIFFWPVKLPRWLWQHETIGKVLASLWLACCLLIGLSLLPKQAGKIERPSAMSNLATNLQPTLLTILRNAATPLADQNVGETSTELTLTKASLVSAIEINPPSTLIATATAIAIPSATLTLTIPTVSPVFTATPLLIPTSTPLPTLTPFNPPTPDPANKLATTPTALVPTSTRPTIVVEPTVAPDVPVVASNPNGFTCVDGCSEAPDPSCAIKGNVNAKGDKIYHIPGGKNYDLTRIKPAEGDRWFCTEQEAQAAGFRAAKSY